MKNGWIWVLHLILITLEKTIAQQTQTPVLKWSAIAELPALTENAVQIGLAGPFSGICGNRLLIAGGANFPDGPPWKNGTKKYHEDIYILRKKGAKFKWQTDCIAKLNQKTAYGASITLPEGILILGGETPGGLSPEVLLLKWNPAENCIQKQKWPELKIPLANAAAVLFNAKIYIAGGETTGRVSDKLYCFDLLKKEMGWQLLADLPYPVSNAVLTAGFGKNEQSLFLIGGRSKMPGGISEFYPGVYQYDIRKNRWMVKQPMPYPLAAGTGACVGKYILMFGGDPGNTFGKVEKLLAEINKEKDEINRVELTKQKNFLLQNHPGFSREILAYDSELDQWHHAGNLPFDTPVSTTALQWGRRKIVPSGEIRAGVRSLLVWAATVKSE